MLLVSGAVLSPAWADGGKDCAPLGSLPNYTAEGVPQQYAYESHDFVGKDKDGGHPTITIAGHYCEQKYDVNKGTESMSDLEVMSNYEDQLDKLGAKVTTSDEAEANAVLLKDGKETWMEVTSHGNIGMVDIVVVNKQTLVPTLLPPSGKDYRLLGHMPDYAAGTPDKSHFDQHAFRVHSDDGDNDVNVQGVRFDLTYALKDGAPEASDVDILGNYRSALEKLGATILYTDPSSMVARYDDHGQAIWMQIDADNNNSGIIIHVIEEKAFHASIKPPDASAMKTALDKDGHIALYINFDFDKATLRPDAAPIIAQVVTLLKDNPDLKLSVDGNTDNVGGHDYNVKLSQQRAAAVVAELVKAGIATDRLKSSGNGPDKPVADNATSRGRAENRRVELVKA
ncbi:MAG: OmpA family protein [Rudaea sp.]